MKRFRFPLEALHDLRLAQEKAAQKNYAAALRQCDAAAMTLAAAETDLANEWQRLRGALLQGMRSEHLRHSRAWCGTLEEKQRELAATLAAFRRAAAAAHQELQAASRRREGLDRLRAKLGKAHHAEVLAEEQNSLDEIALRSFV